MDTNHDPDLLLSLLAYSARRLLAVSRPLPRVIEVVISDGRRLEKHVVRSRRLTDDNPAAVRLAAGATALSGQPLVAHFFSPEERAVVLAVGAGEASREVIGRELRTARLGGSTKAKLIVGNLVRRGVLVVRPGGYALTSPAFLAIAGQLPANR